jgi:NAD(P)-dependent dehydrogenase (short-subunit alcohol dehydrogenase family)
VVVLAGSVVLVTGGQRGIGAALTAGLLDRGAAKVYATSRSPRPATDPRVTPLPFELGSTDSLRALVASAPDVSVLINNAAEAGTGGVLTADLTVMRAFLDVHLLGTVAVSQAFAPVLAINGGGALVNVMSALSWMSGGGAYGMCKAALWNATLSMRQELAPAGTLVCGVHFGYVDTDMVRHVQLQKARPQDIAAAILDGLEAGRTEILADEVAISVKAALSGPVEGLELPLNASPFHGLLDGPPSAAH